MALSVFVLITGLSSILAHQPGWPQPVAGGVDFSSPALADLNGDETLEVVVVSQAHQVYVWNCWGVPFPGWPKSIADSSGLDETSSPAVGDIDHDGSPEVVYASAGGRLWAWRSDGSPVPGFPVNLGDNVIRASVTLQDLDGDDSMEIIIGTGNFQNRLMVFRCDGTLHWQRATVGRVHSTAATGDIDHNGDIELLVGNDGVSGQPGVYAWHNDGTPVTGWPKYCGHHVDPSPALADIDQDQNLEVFFGSLDNFLYGTDGSGADLPGWPRRCGDGIYEGIVSSPAVADIDGDSMLEIVTGRGIIQSNYGAVFAFRSSGETLPGFPVTIASGSVVSSPALADIDDDGAMEVIVGSQDGMLYGWHFDGTVVNGFPIAVGAPVTSSPAIGDIDLDGFTEIAVGAKGDSFYVWDLGMRFRQSQHA